LNAGIAVTKPLSGSAAVYNNVNWAAFIAIATFFLCVDCRCAAFSQAGEAQAVR
jgi:hypothetical protein